MSEQKPRCPWCGREMTASYHPPEDHTYCCIYCRTNSPIRSTPAEAWKAAIGRPLQKPLTLEEIITYQYPVWLEFRLPGGHGWHLGVGLAMNRAEQYFRYYECRTCQYGKDYRFWKTMPTDEERAAAPWEK